MNNSIFDQLSPILQNKLQNFLIKTQESSPSYMIKLHQLYNEYSSRDKYLPRPILSFFGYISNKKDFSLDYLEEMGDMILLPQLLRDFLAIHDDIVDEDLLKFGKPPLPVLYSWISHNKQEIYEKKDINKNGKDLSLFYADYIITLIYSIIQNSSDEEVLRNLLMLTNKTLDITQHGQIHELIMEDKKLYEISINDIIELYTNKAAYYCYVFPIEVGLIMGKCSNSTREKFRDILSKIGVASQIIDDIAGIFPEILNQEKDTINELLYLRRNILLVTLSSNIGEDNPVWGMLNSSRQCTYEQAIVIKNEMIKQGILIKTLNIINTILVDIDIEIKNINTNEHTKSYLLSLLKTRIYYNIDLINQNL